MKSEVLIAPLHKKWARIGLFLTGVMILVLVYVFQRANVAGVVGDFSANTNFVISRTLRLILNDFACFLIVLALFKESRYLRVAFWVFLAELLIILPLYLFFKLSAEGDSEISSPLFSQVHRLIVNPMLMILLIFWFLYQKYFEK